MTVFNDEVNEQDNTYIRYERVHDSNEIYECLDSMKCAKHTMADFGSPREYFKKYFDDAKVRNKRRNYSKECNKNAVYGVFVTMLLPRERYFTVETLGKIADHFVKNLIAANGSGKRVSHEKGLRYIAFIREEYGREKKKLRYLKIWISDREVYIRNEVPIYKRDIYVNEKGKYIPKGTPGAILKCKKGEPIPGRINELKYFKDTKSRLFNLSDESMFWFRKVLHRAYREALESVGIQINKGEVIPRIQIKKATNCYKRRIIIANNRARRYVQNLYNMTLYKLRKNGYESCKDRAVFSELDEEYIGTISEEKYSSLHSLFRRFLDYFENGEYVLNNEEYKIYKTRCNEAEKNCNALMDLFERQITAIAFNA